VKLQLRTERWRKEHRVKNRTHVKQQPGAQPLAKQMRKLRRYYDRMARVAARLEGRPEPMPGVSLKLKLAATMMQTGMTRRQAVDLLLRERAAKLGGEQ
jgi:hypothetical protein